MQFSTQQRSTSPPGFYRNLRGMRSAKWEISCCFFLPLSFLLSCKAICPFPPPHPLFARALCAISFGFRHCPAFSRDSRFIHGRLHNRTSFRFPAHKKRSPHGAAFSFILLICKAKIYRSFPSAAPAPSGPRASAPNQPKSRPRGASPSYSARSPGCRARYSSCVP